jgi:hypothetical protein
MANGLVSSKNAVEMEYLLWAVDAFYSLYCFAPSFLWSFM